MMTIEVKINDSKHVRLSVENRGKPHPEFDGFEGEDDLVCYWVRGLDDDLVGSDVVLDVYHHTKDGACVLAAKVLSEYSVRMRGLGFDV